MRSLDKGKTLNAEQPLKRYLQLTSESQPECLVTVNGIKRSSIVALVAIIVCEKGRKKKGRAQNN